MGKKKSNKKNIVKCEECDQNFSSKDAVSKHKAAEHNFASCSFCGEQRSLKDLEKCEENCKKQMEALLNIGDAVENADIEQAVSKE